MAKPIHFPGLNGIRAIAASIVVVWHGHQFRALLGMPTPQRHTSMAGFAVVMFFVLSGFLITHLLMGEQERTGAIDLRRFYLRRILRIWPPYYLALLIAAPLLFGQPPYPHQMGLRVGCYVFMLPNVAYQGGLALLPIVHLWSVGVEEQFYAIWPLVLRHRDHLLKVLLGVIGIYLLVLAGLRGHGKLFDIWSCSRIDCMAIGGLGAYWLRCGKPGAAVLFDRRVQIAAWCFLAWSVLLSPVHIRSGIDFEAHALVYLILILNVACNPAPVLSLEGWAWDKLGAISYGLYVYHFLILCGLGHLLPGRVPPTVLGAALAYGVFGLLSLLAAAVSYRYFERPFLALKPR